MASFSPGSFSAGSFSTEGVPPFAGIIDSALSMLERSMGFEEGEVEMKLESLEREMKIELVAE